MKSIACLGFLLAGFTLVLILMPGVNGETGVELGADITSTSVEPGEISRFDVRVNNTGDETDTISLNFDQDTREWATFLRNGRDVEEITLNASEERIVQVEVSLPEYSNATGADKDALEGDSYVVRMNATTGDGNASDTLQLTTSILQIYGASLSVQGTDSVVTYPSTESSANDRREFFTLKLKNLGNGEDTINVTTTSYPDEWEVGIHTQSSCSGDFSGSVNADTTVTLYLCVIPNEDSDLGNFTLIIEARADDGAEDPVNDTVTLDVREPTRSFIVALYTNEITLAPEEGKVKEKNTARFMLAIVNTGSHDENFKAEMDSIPGDNWSSPTQTSGKDDWFYTSNDPGSSDRWDKANGETIGIYESENLWLVVIVDCEVDEGNYTFQVTIKTGGGEVSQSFDLKINIEVPQRGLTVIPIDTIKKIAPVYKNPSASDNRVRFKIKLINTGSHADSFIPEIDSLESGWGWEVSFYQDAGRSTLWPASGVTIESGDPDDLWVFVEVDKKTTEGTHNITISVRDKDGDPNARGEVELSVVVQRADLKITGTDITLEVNGLEANASNIYSEDFVIVLVNITNDGNADADNALVEIYYYAKDAIKTDDESEWMNVLYSKRNMFRGHEAGQPALSRQIASNIDWVVAEGEWYIEVRIDFDQITGALHDNNGEYLEINETNNNARYRDSEGNQLLQIIPDLKVVSMKLETKWTKLTNNQTRTPNIDDPVIFKIKIENNGAASVENARLYIFHDNTEASKAYLKMRSQYYLDVDLDAYDRDEFDFRWKAEAGVWRGFRAEINPKYDDVDEPKPFDDTSDHFIDELGRYSDNSGEELTYPETNDEVIFEILPDFIITEVEFFPDNPNVGEEVEVTVTVENIGNADWDLTDGTVKIHFDDGEMEQELIVLVNESLKVGDATEVTFIWTVPDVDKNNLSLKISLEATNGSDDLEQLNTDNDDYDLTVDVNEKGGISAPSLIPTLAMVVAVAVALRRRLTPPSRSA